MKIAKIPLKSKLKVNKSYLGETIEMKLRRIQENKEPIKDGAPLIYQERGDGVHPLFDVRTDRFDLAVEAKGLEAKNNLAKREEIAKIGKEAHEGMKKEAAEAGPAGDSKEPKS